MDRENKQWCKKVSHETAKLMNPTNNLVSDIQHHLKVHALPEINSYALGIVKLLLSK